MTGIDHGRARALLDHAPVAIFETDDEGRNLYVNHEWCEISGLSPEESHGYGYWQVIHPDDADALLRDLVAAQTTGGETRTEFRLRRADGWEPTMLLVSRPIVAADGTRSHLGSLTDITPERFGDHRLRLMLENISDVILVIDGDGVIRFTSPTAHGVLGYVDGTKLGTNALDLVHPDDRLRALQSLGGTLESGLGKKEALLLRIRHADGRWLPVEVVANNLLAHPAVGGIVLAVRDVSHRERVERLLEETESRYRQIVELADEGIWTIDADAITTFVNPRMAAMLGYAPGEMLGEPIFRFMDEEAAAETKDAIERRKAGVSESFDFRLLHRDGTTVWTRVSTSPLTDHNGEYTGAVALITDITAQREIEQALRYNEARLTALFEASSDIMAVMEPDGQWHASPAGTRILGYPMGYEVEGGLLGLVHPDDVELAATAIVEVMEGSRAKHEPIQLRVRHIDGHYLWFECSAESRIDDETVGGIVIIARDITQQRAAQDAQRDAEIAQQEAENRFRAIFESSPLGIVAVGFDGRVIDVNRACCELIGVEEADLLGTEILNFVVPEDREQVMAQGMARLEGRNDRSHEPIRMVRPDGTVFWVLFDSQIVTEADGTQYAIALMVDVSERRLLEQELKHQAHHDPLTGLANRALLRERLDDRWDDRERADLAVLFVDLDRFKEVNDTLGHDAGDEVLQLVAQRLSQVVRGNDLIARYGGDEFVIVCEHVGGADQALTIAGRIRESLARPYALKSATASIAASVGVAVAHPLHAAPEMLLRDADQAAYRAKQAGRNRVELAGGVGSPAAQRSQPAARSSR